MLPVMLGKVKLSSDHECVCHSGPSVMDRESRPGPLLTACVEGAGAKALSPSKEQRGSVLSRADQTCLYSTQGFPVPIIHTFKPS